MIGGMEGGCEDGLTPEGHWVAQRASSAGGLKTMAGRAKCYMHGYLYSVTGRWFERAKHLNEFVQH